MQLTMSISGRPDPQDGAVSLMLWINIMITIHLQA
jgi:hypothetical protein